MVAVSMVSAYFGSDFLAVGLCGSLLCLLIAGRIFGYNETLLFFHYMRVMSLLLVDASGIFRTRLFLARMSSEELNVGGDYWDDLTGYVQLMGGYELEFVHRNDLDDSVIATRVWSAGESRPAAKTSLADWKFSYSLPGRRRTRVTLVASGASAEEPKSERLVDLYQLFASYCRSRVNDDAESAPIPVLAMRAHEPRVLPATSSAATDAQSAPRKVA
jgi:hypothetical protein